LEEDENLGTIEIRVLIENNTLRILLNTSGAGLHKRGYREMTGDAPMKENLAAALVILSGWKYKEPLYDIFCGSGTIAIEAAMIARNIAPGRRRSFAFESWNWLPENILKQEIELASTKEFSGTYKIYATDIRKDVQQLAQRNASFAGVGDTITFGSQDYKTYLRREIEGTMISNPPYGLRLEETNVPQIHKDIAQLFEQNKNLGGGIITAHGEFESYSKIKYKRRKLYNGGEQVYFYKKEF
jgi:putative N6-adenine-specific DNA methylase